MRAILVLLTIVVTAPAIFAAKKVISPTTSAGNEDIDIVATISLTEEEVTQKLGIDPGKGIVILQVRVTPKTDKSVQVDPSDFILLAHNDGERTKPFEPSELAGDGALVVKNTADQKTKNKTTPSIGFGGMAVGGGGASPGNSKPVALSSTMDTKNQGNKELVTALKAKQLTAKDTTEPVEGYLYFSLDGKHKLKDLAVLYRGPAGRLDLEFEH
jgi:hypothetical protein